MEVSQDMLLL